MKRYQDWYAHPEYYEAIFGPDSAKEMDFLQEVNRRYGNGGKSWLEPACGAGRLLEEGARRGLNLVGYDLSEPMLEHARARLAPALRRRVKVHPGRMEDFAPPALVGKIDLAFSLVSTFRYLDTHPAAVAHLHSVRKLLKDDGRFVLGFHLTDYTRDFIEHERWVGEVNGRKVVCNTREWPPDSKRRRSRMRNRLRVTGKGDDFQIETDWHFRTYDTGQVLTLIKDGGFQLEALFDFDYLIDQPSHLGTDRLDWVMVLAPL